MAFFLEVRRSFDHLPSTATVRETMRFAIDPSSSSSSSAEEETDEYGLKAVGTLTAKKKETQLERIEAARRLASPPRLGPALHRPRVPPWMQQRQRSGGSSLVLRSLKSPGGVPFEEDEDEDEDEGVQRGALDSDEDGSSDEQDEDEDEDEDDSEEEQWPVRPGRIGRGQGLSSRIRLVSKDDEWDEWERRTRDRAWSMQARRQRSVSLKPDDALEDTARRSAPSSSAATRGGAKRDLDDVESLLDSLRLQQDEEEKQDREAFEQRNRKLWDNIEAGIRAAEQVREKEAQEEAARLRAARAAQEEAERRAREQREEEERKIREENEAKEAARRKAEEEARQEEERLKAAERERSLGGATLRLEAKQEYERWWAKMSHIKTAVLPLVSANNEWRKQCFQAKRQITRGVSQLTNSRQEIMRVTESIGNVLTLAKGASPNGEIYTWILNHLSKCLIRQAEQEVAAKQDTAFPLARIVSFLLLQGHAELGDALMARLTKKCPWVLGYCPVKRGDMDDAAYAKLVGRAGLDEASLQFTSRMCGILAFYAAVAQTHPDSGSAAGQGQGQGQGHDRIPPAFRPAALWTWMARSVTPPMTDHALIPALWSTIIEVAGPKLLAIYGKQCAKVWTLLLDVGIRQKKAGFADDETANAARTRLLLLLEDWKKTGGTTVSGATGGREMALP